MNGKPRAQGCAGAVPVRFARCLTQDALERPVFVFAQLMLDTHVRPVRLRVAHPCAQSRSTVHPEHNTLGSGGNFSTVDSVR